MSETNEILIFGNGNFTKSKMNKATFRVVQNVRNKMDKNKMYTTFNHSPPLSS